ncbi:MAG: hypothetical protein H6711_22835 [Myxococcales bacterium]|nr:hypothetical protein [Myxococcales bacterium]
MVARHEGRHVIPWRLESASGSTLYQTLDLERETRQLWSLPADASEGPRRLSASFRGGCSFVNDEGSICRIGDYGDEPAEIAILHHAPSARPETIASGHDPRVLAHGHDDPLVVYHDDDGGLWAVGLPAWLADADRFY